MKDKKIFKKLNAFGEEGVSPIIAIILMVAITVVLAATIYVWVSGFGGGDAGTEVVFTLQQTGHGGNGSFGWVSYTVNAVSGNPGYEDLEATIGGQPATIMTTFPTSLDQISNATGAVNSGDEIYVITTHYTSEDDLPGLRLKIEHVTSHTLIYSATISYA